uniref:Transmembrane protein n=1 Tax=Salix viminalis TaxID=40686 RepID=A0A6N2LMC8_SALVM
MNFPFTLLFTILFVSFSHLILHSSSAMEKLEDTGNTKMESSNLKVKVSTVRNIYDILVSFVGYLVNFQSFADDQGDHVQRKHLHEVHSGPNPVSNSVPLRKWKTRFRGSP